MRKSLTTTSRPTEVIMQGNIQQILEELDWLENDPWEDTYGFADQATLIQFLMDVFIYLNTCKGDDLADVVKKVHDAATF